MLHHVGLNSIKPNFRKHQWVLGTGSGSQLSNIPDRKQTVEKIESPLKNRYFGIRHGQSEANVQGIISSDVQGAYAYPLTELGKEQAQGM